MGTQGRLEAHMATRAAFRQNWRSCFAEVMRLTAHLGQQTTTPSNSTMELRQ